MKSPASRNFALSVTALLLILASLAPAQQAGYDLLQTGSDASINLSSVRGLSPGVVPLHGVPICACTGATDTIMHRTAKEPDGRANLTVIALFLKNKAAVTLNGKSVDIYITVNNSNGVIGQNTLPQPDPLPPSTGFLVIHGDGTFDSNFTVNADVIVVTAGANVRDPATHIYHHEAPAVHLGATGSPWSATAPPGYPECFFPANGFYPGGPVPERDPTNPEHRHPVAPSATISATLSAVPPSFTGRCPAHINFEGQITTNAAADVTYTFIRSDGATGPNFTLHFAGPGSQAVHTDWTLGGFPELPNYSGWEAVKILSPGALQSNHATFTVTCTR